MKAVDLLREPAGNVTVTAQTRVRARYKQIEETIRQSIERGDLQTGGQLPTEAELCRQFGVSRSTIRTALKSLEKDGLITRTRGRGTFVREPDLTANGAAAGGSPSSARAATRSTIGVNLCFSVETDVLQTAILLGIENAAKSRGYGISFGRVDDDDEEGETKSIQHLYEAGVKGMAVMPISNRMATPGVKMLVDRQVPVVLVDRYLGDLDASYVVSDNFAGAYRVTEHLILLGFRCFRFVVPSSPPVDLQLATSSIRDRYRGFCKALLDYRVYSQVPEPSPVSTSNAEEVRHLLSADSPAAARPVAVVVLHDLIAMALMSTAAQIGLHAPQDFAIVGFDDLPLASHLAVPLTTVIQPRYDIGFRAGHMLIDKIEGHPIRNDKLSLLVSLIVRESCGARRITAEYIPASAQRPASR